MQKKQRHRSYQHGYSSNRENTFFNAKIEKKKRYSVFVHRTAIVDRNVEIGAGTKIWHFSHICKDVTIGSGCVIGQNVFIASGVRIGNGCKIQNNVSVYSGVTLQDDVFLGPSMVFTNVKNPRANIDRKDCFMQTIVKKGATIGANATVMCGIVIGENALIGAGAIVTKDIPENALMIGKAAEQVGSVTDNANEIYYANGRNRQFTFRAKAERGPKEARNIAKFI